MSTDTSTTATTDETPQAGTAPESTPATTEPTATEPPAGTETSGDVATLPDWAQREIRQARSEAQNVRARAKDEKVTAAQEAEKALVDKLAAALGLAGSGDDAPTPEQLTEQAEQARSDARAARVELAVHQRSGALKADAAALLDSRGFLARLDGLDPAADGFATQVDEAIRSAVADNPKLAAASTVGASSVDHAGGTGEGAVTQARFDAMSPAERNALYKRDPTTYRQLSGR